MNAQKKGQSGKITPAKTVKDDYISSEQSTQDGWEREWGNIDLEYELARDLALSETNY